MTALAGMTVVVEAADHSGAMVTARLASEYRRPIGAVPGPVTSRASVGPNSLLSTGAVVVRDAGDVLAALD
jgi:DNA processing protein